MPGPLLVKLSDKYAHTDAIAQTRTHAGHKRDQEPNRGGWNAPLWVRRWSKISPFVLSSSPRLPPAFTQTHRQTTPPLLSKLESHLHGGAMSLRALLRLEADYLGLKTAALLLMADCVTWFHTHTHTSPSPPPTTSLSGFLGAHASFFLHLRIVPTPTASCSWQPLSWSILPILLFPGIFRPSVGNLSRFCDWRCGHEQIGRKKFGTVIMWNVINGEIKLRR